MLSEKSIVTEIFCIMLTSFCVFFLILNLIIIISSFLRGDQFNKTFGI